MTALLEKEIVLERADKNCANNTINREIDTIIKLRDSLDGSLTQALNLMQNAKGRIIITGMGKSGHIGKKIAASLASTNIFVLENKKPIGVIHIHDLLNSGVQ